MDIEILEVFQNSHLGGTDQKSSSFWSAETLVGKQLSFTIAKNQLKNLHNLAFV